MLALLLLSHAHAGSYFFIDSGTRALGRGGAFVVGADDFTAQYYNPAALINIKRPQLGLNGWTVGESVSFDRADEAGEDGQFNTGDDLIFQEVNNEAPWIIEPAFSYAAPLGGLSPKLANTVVAFGFYPPSSPNMGYDPLGPQRYSLVNSTILSGYLGPSVAQRITPWLTVGAGAQYSFLSVSETLASVGAIDGMTSADGSDNPNDDVGVDVAVMDPFGFGWNAGLIVEPTDWLQIGASFQGPIAFQANGSLTSSFNPNHIFLSALASDSFVDDDITLSLTLPATARVGVQVTPGDKLRVELDGTWTQWSKLPALNITNLDLVLEHKEGSPLLTEDIVLTDDIVIKTGFQDNVSVRLGGDYMVTKAVQVRGGVHFETSAVDPKLMGQSVVDGTKFGLGLGATVYAGKRFSFDLGASETVTPEQTISDSELTQVVVSTTIGEHPEVYTKEGKVIGNGTVASHTTFVGVGATLYFGPGEVE